MRQTQNEIIDTFWQLLEEKAYSKITVKDIVDRLQINRNTFYYHFHDIPELLELTIKRDAEQIILMHSRFGSPMDCLKPLVEHSISHQKALLHIYHSLHREIFLDELDKIILYIVTQYIETVTSSELSLSEADKKLLIRLYKCMLVGIFLDWLNEDMAYDLLAYFARICDLFSGSGKQALLKSTQS